MYDELVNRLRERAADFDYDGWVETATDYEKAADAIEELSRKYIEERNAAVELTGELASKPRWIPVTERLPGSGFPTLICGDGNVVEQGFFDDEYGYWYDWDCNRTFVHHWMPLPQPPKEE